MNALIEDRIALLRAANQGVIYNTQLTAENAVAKADEDLVKGVLESSGECRASAGPGGVVLGKTAVQNGKVTIEIHDSGPGLSVHAKELCLSRRYRSRKREWVLVCPLRNEAR